MSGVEGSVEVLARDEVSAVVGVLCESFFDYPVMRWVLGSGDGYSRRVECLMTFFTMARVLRDEKLLGIRGSNGLTAAALIAYPGARQSPDELGALRERLWEELGAEARARYESFGAATAAFDIEESHIHLSMIGTVISARGRGLGRLLMDAVHDLSAADARSTGVTLTTEVEANVALYQHLGYELIGRAKVGSALTTWGFFRRDRSAPS